MPPRIEKLSVKNLRSIGHERVTIRFPENGALVLLGENNAGKSNVTRALDILFGNYWPGTRRLEDHDFHGRDSDGIAVEVGATMSDIPCPYCSSGEVEYLSWTYDTQDTALDQRRFDARRLDAGERVGMDLAAGGEPGREAPYRELPYAGGAWCGAGVEPPRS